MTLSTIIPSLLNGLVNKRVWRNTTPDDIPRDANGNFQPFLLWSTPGGIQSEYVDQTMGQMENRRLQIAAFSPSVITTENLIRQVRDTLLASDYTVGVYGSPVGTYDTARKLHGEFQQYSIWYPQ